MSKACKALVNQVDGEVGNYCLSLCVTLFSLYTSQTFTTPRDLDAYNLYDACSHDGPFMSARSGRKTWGLPQLNGALNDYACPGEGRLWSSCG